MNLHNKHFFRLALILIATVFYFLANIHRAGIPGAIFDILQGDFKSGACAITFLGAIFCYTYAFVQLIVGLLVDKIGGFRVIAAGSVLFAIGAMLFPFSSNLILLYLSRIFVGFAAATFYLSTVREVKKYAKDSNFSLAVSYILFFGYSGGIIANAPLVLCVNNLGWRNVFSFIGFFTLVLSILYLIILALFRPVHIEKETKFSLSPFREILSNKKNITLYIFGGVNYGLYYVLQSVIGKKFLQDFCNFDINKAAVILSIMALICACAGTITAFISKCMNNKRAPIFKLVSVLSFISFLTVFLCLAFDFHTKLIAFVFLIPAFIGSISPLLILSIHLINRYEICATAVSIQNFGFFMTVGILGTLCGALMNVFKPNEINGVLIYGNQSYMLVFGLFLLLSIVEMFFAFKIEDK